MPKVDAIILSHEHLDHFHIPSLNKLPKDAPFYVSHLLPICVKDLIRELGFKLIEVFPMETANPVVDIQLTRFRISVLKKLHGSLSVSYHLKLGTGKNREMREVMERLKRDLSRIWKARKTAVFPTWVLFSLFALNFLVMGMILYIYIIQAIVRW